MPKCGKIKREELVRGTATGPSSSYNAVYDVAVHRAKKAVADIKQAWRDETCPDECKVKKNFEVHSEQLYILQGEGDRYRDTSTYTVVWKVWAEWDCEREAVVEEEEPAPATPEPVDSTASDEEETPICCPEKVWLGYGWSTGGTLGLGKESGEIYFFCLSNPNQYVSLNFSGTRIGADIGGGFNFIGAVAWNVEHANEIPPLFYQWFQGFDFKLDIGIGLPRLLKLLFKGRKFVRAVKILLRLARQKKRIGNIDAKTLKNLRRAVSPNLPRGSGNIVVFPVGAGLEVGVFYLSVDKVVVLPDFNSCGDPPRSIGD